MKTRIYAIFLTLFVLACGAGLTGLAYVDLEVLGTNNSTEIGNALSEFQLAFGKAKIVLSEIEFEQAINCDDDDDENEFDYEGPYIVNLLTRDSQPSLDEVQLEPGRYCKMKLKLDELEDDELPSGVSQNDEMVGLSLLIEGQVEGSVNFILRIEEDQEYELESVTDNGFLLNPDETQTLFLVFDIGQLFSGIDFDELDVVNDTAVIDEDNNEDAYDVIKENLKSFSSLSSDSDEDDEYDDDDEEIAD